MHCGAFILKYFLRKRITCYHDFTGLRKPVSRFFKVWIKNILCWTTCMTPRRSPVSVRYKIWGICGWWEFDVYAYTGIILYMRPANERRRYIVTSYVYAPSQCETTLHCNVVSHWLHAYTKWSLLMCVHCYAFLAPWPPAHGSKDAAKAGFG